MTKKEADKQIDAIKKVTADLISKGPEACRDFLIAAGIIKEPPATHDTFLIGIANGRITFLKSYDYLKQKDEAQSDLKYVSDEENFTGYYISHVGQWILEHRDDGALPINIKMP